MNNLWHECHDHSMGKTDSLFNIWCWGFWVSICKRIKLDPYLTPYTKNCQKKLSKWIKDVSLRPKTLKLLKENTIKSSWHWTCNGFLDRTPKTAKKAKIDKWNYIKLKKFWKFCASKNIEWKGVLQNGRKYLQIVYLIRD